ncbi:hypothetical protein [Kingella kingae]|uniref:hypothetical protein n=1 Tax=Kingella kingae TaxID=504 RepID=UPI00076129CB
MNIVDFFVMGYFKFLLQEYGIFKRQIITQNIMAMICFFVMLFLSYNFFPYHEKIINAIVVFIVGITCGGVAVYITTRTLNRRDKYLFLGKVFPLFPSIESTFFFNLLGKNMVWMYITWLFSFLLVYDTHDNIENLIVVFFIFFSWLTSFCWSIMNFFIVLHLLYRFITYKELKNDL